MLVVKEGESDLDCVFRGVGSRLYVEEQHARVVCMRDFPDFPRGVDLLVRCV